MSFPDTRHDGPGDATAGSASTIPVVPIATRTKDVRQLIAIGELRIALAFSEARAFVEVGALARVPRAPDWLRGLFRHDGSVTALVDLQDWIEGRNVQEVGAIPSSASALLFGAGSGAWAVRVNGSPSVFDASGLRPQTLTRDDQEQQFGRLAAFVHQTWTLAPEGMQVIAVRWEALCQELTLALSQVRFDTPAPSRTATAA